MDIFQVNFNPTAIPITESIDLDIDAGRVDVACGGKVGNPGDRVAAGNDQAPPGKRSRPGNLSP